MHDLHHHWSKLEADLKALLEGLPALSEPGRASVYNFIDHNEFGLAFETLCDALKEHETAISPAQYKVIVALQVAIKLTGVAEAVSHLRQS